jgi:hypothetical protein
MMLGKLAWWALGVWVGGGGLFIVLYVLGEFVANIERGWRASLGVIARRLPIVTPLVLLLWPVLLGVLAYAVGQVLREQALEVACSGSVVGSRKGPLTESEWLTGTNAAELVAGLPALAGGERKLRLFAVACCRRMAHRLSDPRSHRALDVAERYANGLASAEELQQASAEAAEAASLLAVSGDLEAGAAAKACHDASLAVVHALGAAERAAHADYRTRRAERRQQCELLRDIVGNPFRPLPSQVFPPEVRALAQACAEGDVALYPVLADALEEMGEAEAAAHCRQGAHFQGCHVLDWVLGLG